MQRRLAWLVPFVLFGSTTAQAAPDVVFPSEPSSMQGVLKGTRVVLYGPVTVPASTRNANGGLSFYFEGVDMGGHPFSSSFVLVDASNPPKGPFVLDLTNSFGGVAGMEGSPSHPIDVPVSVNDYEVESTPYRPLTHLKKWKKVMVAIAIQTGQMKLKRIVLTTDVNRLAREKVGPRAKPRPVNCGDHSCSGDTPICCVSKGEHTCTAAADCLPAPSTLPLGCTQQQDCPGQRCCLNMAENGPTFTACQPEADCPAASEKSAALPICTTAADCPATVGKFKLRGCESVMYMEQTYCIYK